MLLSSLFVENLQGKGRSVFTNAPIGAGEIIEVSPVIVMSAREWEALDSTALHDYIFVWGEERNQCCMALGYVPLYNHSYKSNCEYFMDFDNNTMMIKTVRNIVAGEELTINYNGDWNNEDPVWFETE